MQLITTPKTNSCCIQLFLYLNYATETKRCSQEKENNQVLGRLWFSFLKTILGIETFPSFITMGLSVLRSFAASNIF